MPRAMRLSEPYGSHLNIDCLSLDAIIEGCAMDLERVRYETAEELEPYCYRVASAVGLCCIEIFGYTDPRARQYAIDLGKALQLTNIMRDVGVDARAGRVYLPQRDLKDFGVSEDDLVEGRYGEPFVRLMVHQAVRARRFYAAAHASYPAAGVGPKRCSALATRTSRSGRAGLMMPASASVRTLCRRWDSPPSMAAAEHYLVRQVLHLPCD